MPVPLAERIVEVIADLGQGVVPRYRYGSGCIVRGRTVLTAAHVVAAAQTVHVRRPDKILRPTKIDPQFVGGDGAPDLALVEIDDQAIDLAPIQLAAVDRDGSAAMPVEGCHVIGYPRFMKRPSAGRETTDAFGHVPVLAGLVSGLLTVQVTAPPRPLPPKRTALGETEWAGISGAPVVADGCLLGVVSERAPREGPASITAVPLTALEADQAHPLWGSGVRNAPDWWARLGVSGSGALRQLPVLKARPEAAYWATVREIHGRTPQLVGRVHELAELAAFATGVEHYRWLTSKAWAGKTALIAEAIVAARPPSVDVIAYFLSRRETDADSNRFLAAVVPQLAYLVEQDSPVPSLEEFRALWSRAASRAAETGRHLLLVVDGLDEDLRPRGVSSVARLLPAIVGANAHVLITSRPHLELDVPAGHPLTAVSSVELTASPDAEDIASRAREEIHDLLDGADQDLAAEVLGVPTAADVLGILTAAAGALSIDDLATLTGGLEESTPARVRHIDRLVTENAARTLQPVGPTGHRRYQFAHGSLLEQAQTDERFRILRHSQYRRRIDQWADRWRDADWPVVGDDNCITPRYLLDEYPATLVSQPLRFSALVGDVGWVAAALQTVGVDRVMADLETAQSSGATPGDASALLAVLRIQAPNLRSPQPVILPGYVLRQLCLQAAELGEDQLAEDARKRLLAQPGARLVPLWTTRRTSRALSVQSGLHEAAMTALAVLPDGRVVFGGQHSRVRVWEPASPGAEPVDLGQHDGWIRALAVLADGRVVSGGDNGLLRMYDPASPGGPPIDLGWHDGRIYGVAVLPDGRVVSGGGDGRLRVWDPAVPSAEPIDLGRHDAQVRAVAVLPDGRVVSGGTDGRMQVWDPAEPAALPVELGQREPWVLATAVLPDGRVVSGGDDGQLFLWDPAAPDAGPVQLGGHDRRVLAVAVLPDGRVVSGGDDKRLWMWGPHGQGTGPVELGRHDHTIEAVAVFPDGRVISASSGQMRVWDQTAGGAPVDRGAHDDWAPAVALLSDGRVVSGGEDGRVRVWDPAEFDSASLELGRHEGWVNAVVPLPDGRVVSGGDDGRLLLCDPAVPDTGPVELGRHAGRVKAIAVLLDGRVVSGGEEVRVWDPAEPGAGPVDLGVHDGWVTELAALPDGRVVSGAHDGRLLLWDPSASGTAPIEIGRYEGWTFGLTALPDGRVVDGGSDGRVRVWDPAAPGSAPVALCIQTGSARVGVLPDGRVVSAGTQMRIWDVTETTPIAWAACQITAIAVASGLAKDQSFLTVHAGHGMTMWSV